MRMQLGRWGRWLAISAAIVVSYVALAVAGRELGVFGPLSVWFPPAGLALAAGLVARWRALPSLAVSEFISGALVFGIADEFTVLQMVLNAAGYASVWCLAGALLHRRGFRVPVTSTRVAIDGILIGMGAAPGLAAAYGVGMRLWAGTAETSGYLSDVAVWWIGDAIGVLTFTPALLVLVLQRAASHRRALHDAVPPTVGTVLLLAAPTLTATVLFGLLPEATGLLSLVAVPLIVVALRRGTIGLAVAAVPLSLALTWMANQRIGDLVLERTDLQVLLLGVIVTGYLVAVPTDESRRLHRRLTRQGEDLDRAQGLARMGSFRWDATNGRTRWSRGMFQLYGWPHDRPAPDLDEYLAAIREDHRPQVEAAIATVVDGGAAIEHTYPIVAGDGAHRWVLARVEGVRDDDGAVRGLAGYCRDVTEQQRIEHARRRAAEDERAAADHLAQVERIKDALLVAVSHEVRTPLTVIAGLVATLGRDETQRDPELVRHLLSRLEPSVVRLDQLLTDLLDTDRLSRGAVVPHLRETHLPDLVDAVLTFHDVTTHPLQVRVDVDHALVDSGLLARMVESLLVNAVRYTPPGTPIVLGLVPDGRDLIVAVDDRGTGVPAEQRAAIFEAFHQDQRVAHAPGAGIGLYLVARFAELHGGTAWVEDRAGGGASFRIRLPGALEDRAGRAEAYRMSPGT